MFWLEQFSEANSSMFGCEAVFRSQPVLCLAVRPSGCFQKLIPVCLVAYCCFSECLQPVELVSSLFGRIHLTWFKLKPLFQECYQMTSEVKFAALWTSGVSQRLKTKTETDSTLYFEWSTEEIALHARPPAPYRVHMIGYPPVHRTQYHPSQNALHNPLFTLYTLYTVHTVTIIHAGH